MHFLLDTPGGSGLYLSFNIMSWLIVTCLISMALWQVSSTKIIYHNRSHSMFFIGFLFLLIPYFYQSEFKEHVTLQLLGVFAGLLFLLALEQFQQLKKRKDALLWLILAAVMIQCIVSFIEFFILDVGDHPGFNPHKARPFGLFLQPNVMASFLATGIAIALYLSTKLTTDNKFQHAVIKAIVFICTFFLIIQNSRAGMLGAFLAIVLLAPRLFKIQKKNFIHHLSIITLAIILAKIALIYHPISLIKKSHQNILARQEIYQISSKMILDKPITGYGYGSFERSYLDYHNNAKLTDSTLSSPLLKLDHPHNEILYWGVEGGIVALIGLGLFAFGYLRLFKNVTKTTAMALIALVIPITIHSQVEYPFYSSASHWLILLLLIYYTTKELNINLGTLPLSSSLLPRFFSLLVFVIFSPFLLSTFHTANIVTTHEKNGHQNIQSFRNIINPLPWRSRIEANIYAHQLIVGFRDKDEKLLQGYIEWGLRRVKHAPRISIYSNILLCLKTLKNKEQYQKVLKEAKTTYPEQLSWKSEIIKKDKEDFNSIYLDN